MARNAAAVRAVSVSRASAGEDREVAEHAEQRDRHAGELPRSSDFCTVAQPWATAHTGVAAGVVHDRQVGRDAEAGDARPATAAGARHRASSSSSAARRSVTPTASDRLRAVAALDRERRRRVGLDRGGVGVGAVERRLRGGVSAYSSACVRVDARGRGDVAQEVVGHVAGVLGALRGVERLQERPQPALLLRAGGDLRGADRVRAEEAQRARLQLDLAGLDVVVDQRGQRLLGSLRRRSGTAGRRTR